MPGHTNSHQDELAELALKRVVDSGDEYGDIRFLDSTTQTIRGEDRPITRPSTTRSAWAERAWRNPSIR